MKRSSGEEADVTRRKSVRLAVEDRPDPLRELEVGKYYLNYGDAQDLCNAYNHLLPFFKQRPKRLTVKPAEDVAKAIREIEAVAERAQQELNRKCRSLEWKIRTFAQYSVCGSGSYERGNLLALPLEALEYAASNVDIADKEHFMAYVRKIIPEAMAMEPMIDEDPAWDRTGDDEDDICYRTFNLKLTRVFQIMLDNDLRFEAAQAMVLTKSLHHRRIRRVASARLTDAHNLLDDDIRMCFTDSDQIPADVRSDCKDEEHPEDHSKHKCVIRSSGVSWIDPPTTPELRCAGHQNFAAAMRVLRTAYMEHRCISRSSYDYDDYFDEDRPSYHDRTLPCFHEHNVDLLEWLQKKAWAEIRSGILRVIGKRLPIELAEHILEFALVAEDVPAEPSVRQRWRPKTSEYQGEQGRRSCLQTRLKAEYQCRRTRYDTHDEYSNPYPTEVDEEVG